MNNSDDGMFYFILFYFWVGGPNKKMILQHPNLTLFFISFLFYVLCNKIKI